MNARNTLEQLSGTEYRRYGCKGSGTCIAYEPGPAQSLRAGIYSRAVSSGGGQDVSLNLSKPQLFSLRSASHCSAATNH